MRGVAGTKFVHIQVKTYLPGNKTCSVGVKAEKEYQDNFFWVLGGIKDHTQDAEFEFYVIPAAVILQETKAMRRGIAGEWSQEQLRYSAARGRSFMRG